MVEIDRTLERMLAAPFPPRDIEYRLNKCGKSKSGKVWGKCLVYVTNRAIMHRLDECMGVAGWYNEQPKPGPDGGVIQGLTLIIDGLRLTKWCGAENTKVHPVKGGLSDAMKRAAYLWGIGRYLYRAPKDCWINVNESGEHFASTKETGDFKWDPPKEMLDFVCAEYTPPRTPEETAKPERSPEETAEIVTAHEQAIAGCNSDEIRGVGLEIAESQLPDEEIVKLKVKYTARQKEFAAEKYAK